MLAQDAHDVVHHIGVLAQVFFRSPQAVLAGLVLLWVGMARNGARQRVDEDARAFAAYQQLGARTQHDGRRLGVAAFCPAGHGEGVAVRIAPQQVGQHGVVGDGGVQLHIHGAREHDLADTAFCIQL
ncbi:hypothetical protein D3C71_1637600 [compost metagenome]